MNADISGKESENRFRKRTYFSCSVKQPWPNNDPTSNTVHKDFFFFSG